MKVEKQLTNKSENTETMTSELKGFGGGVHILLILISLKGELRNV